MGKLGSQPYRERFDIKKQDVESQLETAREIALSTGFSVDTVIQALISMQLNRLNEILIESGDRSDENLAGIGEKIESVSNN